MRRVLAIGAIVVLLSGCAPSMDAAIEKCAQAFAGTLAETQDGGLSDAEKELVLEDGREMCATFAEDDAEGFLEEWG